MLREPSRRWSSFLLVLPALATTASGHDFYILPEAFVVTPRAKIQVAFHNGDSFPESESSPVLARLKDAQLHSAAVTVPIQNLKVEGKRVMGIVEIPERGGEFLLSGHTTPNFISLAPDKFLDYLKEEGLADVIQWRNQHGEENMPSRERYSKFAKALVTSGTKNDFNKQSLGFPIEIVPDVSPFTRHAGQDLPVRVLFRGKATSGLQLEAAWASGGKAKTTIIGRTDAEGRIRVPLPAAGKWRLHSLVMERCSEPAAADWESFWASFTFEIQ